MKSHAVPTDHPAPQETLFSSSIFSAIVDLKAVDLQKAEEVAKEDDLDDAEHGLPTMPDVPPQRLGKNRISSNLGEEGVQINSPGGVPRCSDRSFSDQSSSDEEYLSADECLDEFPI